MYVCIGIPPFKGGSGGRSKLKYFKKGGCPHGCVPHTTPRNISAKKFWFIMVSPGPGCMHVCIYMYVRTSKMKGCAIYHLWAQMWHPEDPPHFFWKPKKHVGVVYFMWSGEIFLRNLLSYPPNIPGLKGGMYTYM